MRDEAGEVWFRLSPIGDPHGLSCDERGVFLGRIPLLERVSQHQGREYLAPRPADDLNREFEILYGAPVEMSGTQSGLSTIARALNRGNLALAKIASVQMQLPKSRRAMAPDRLHKLCQTAARRSGQKHTNFVKT